MKDGPNRDFPHEDQETEIDGTVFHISTYYSLAEFARRALERETKSLIGGNRSYHVPSQMKGKDYGDEDDSGMEWGGGKSLEEMVEMATGDGWSELLSETLNIAENAVAMAEAMHEVQSFEPTFDVAGEDVDVDRYLSGEPENMIDYPLVTTSKYGKVITLVSAGCVSAAISPADYQRRGQVLAALAIALERLGHATELWLDMGYSSYGGDDGKRKQYHSRILVKGTNDAVDPAQIMLAYAHPGTLRKMGFADCDGHAWSRRWGGRGMPADACRVDMPESAIYTPSLRSGYSRHDVHTELKGYLKLLGLLQDGSDD